MGYSPIIGRFLQRDPLPLPSGRNFYEFVAGDPLGLLDPFGLDPTTAPTGVIVDPIKFGNEIPLQGTDFGPNYIDRPGWGDTHYKDGHVATDLTKLTLPGNLPPCIKDATDLQKAIDAFNDLAKKHEQETQDWFQSHYDDWKNNRKRWNTDHANRFDKHAPWELQELQKMYTSLLATLTMCNCPDINDKALESNIKAVKEKIADEATQLKAGPPTKPFR